MWNKLLTLLVLVEGILGAAVVEEKLVTTSFEFLDKYSQKQYRNIASITISNASITKIDPKLKYLKNLRYLDLSYNNIHIASIPTLNNLKVLKLNGNSLKSINMSLLPKNIEDLDLSNNLLQHIPKDWRNLRSLKTLHLHKNPIDCDCNNVLNYERLVKSGINVPETVICHYPKKYVGRDIASVNCSLDDIMLYDEPEEGSGESNIFEESLTETKNIPLFEEEDQPGSIAIVDDLIEVHSTTTEASKEELLEEGSGSEGSGFMFAIPESGILGCIENCSTPLPVGINDEEYASPPPSPLDQIKILLDDLNPFKTFDEVTTTSTTTPSTTTTSTTETPILKEKEVVKEPRLFKEKEDELEAEKVSDKDAEGLTNSSSIHELERASSAPQNTNAVYAIAAIFSFLAILFVVCFIKKRRTSHRNKNRRDDANTPGEEMKPLSKPSVQQMNDKPSKKNIPENIPLINGQNGTHKSDSPELKSYTPLEHPDKLEPDEQPVQMNGQMVPEMDEIEFRPKQPELLTPQTERVTIREAEIPESIPRTPLLIHRQKNSEGEIITTVVP